MNGLDITRYTVLYQHLPSKQWRTTYLETEEFFKNLQLALTTLPQLFLIILISIKGWFSPNFHPSLDAGKNPQKAHVIGTCHRGLSVEVSKIFFFFFFLLQDLGRLSLEFFRIQESSFEYWYGKWAISQEKQSFNDKDCRL